MVRAFHANYMFVNALGNCSPATYVKHGLIRFVETFQDHFVH